ncbi:VCBS repeat-containing protein [Abyssalbus ytuae]|uniref:VCBS repeat-containing protein n=1 Tax=Abyssalbus ytuae TaxID=2926907 RepID=A0A9E7CUQ4_9FLAO|nr:VCBS repeat-containing protein [Abyssalbus ytuae]UOB18807.1 VCBS repeat-containing protein [Abyssalbus ytuae]
MFKSSIIIFISLILIFSCEKEGNKLFEKINPLHSKIDFKNSLTSTPELNILTYLYYYNGGGVALADFNNDGLTDIYFTGNQTEDKLYLNKNNFEFEDVTIRAGISNSGNWTTGVTTVDINNDGLMDIYVCKTGKLLNFKGENLLWVNKGPDEMGYPKFINEASQYNLNIQSFSTQASFFDYDLDGDLDMYLLNHSVHPNRTYGHGTKRHMIDSLAGDKLFKNENGKFLNVSQKAGINQGVIGYGLGISTADINNDGYPDIYIGNDFFENDYLYINQKNGTFKEVISTDETKLGHTTHYSMGNDIADINNDGLEDIMSVDMLPQDINSFKTSGAEHNFQIYSHYLKNGYSPQYMQNSIHINNGNGTFSETAFVSGIAASEWSWAPLLADYDNDGYKDIFISNGILGATNDMDFINFIANDRIQEHINKGMNEDDLKFINELPTKHVPNYFFKNTGENSFVNVTGKWFKKTPSYSNGSAYADLDNDGDLDIVVNNVNEKGFILKNNTEKFNPSNNYLKIKFNGSKENRFGIGAIVKIYRDSTTLTSQNFITRGYLSSISPELHFGLGKKNTIDSLQVIWPDGKYSVLKEVSSNQQIIVNYSDAAGNYYKQYSSKKRTLLQNTQPAFNFKHKEYTSVEFNRDPLIPFANTNQGPSAAVADINGDGLEDMFIGGGKKQSSVLFTQQEDGLFVEYQTDLFKEDAISEDIDNLFFDADGDGDQDLIVVNGGNEFTTGNPLKPRLYLNDNGTFQKDTTQFKNIFINASSVTSIDIDNDNDLDICITSNGIPHEFGKTPRQYIFKSNGDGQFIDETKNISKDFQNIGIVQDIIWIDLNKDNYKDAIIAGHWMPISIFMNDGKKLTLQTNNLLNKTHGWWNAVKAADFDNDGDIDIIAGNWGLNTRLKASPSEPIKLYSNDFDNNGSVEPVVTYFYEGKETTFSSKDELVKQMPFLNKKFLSYADFAKAGITDLFSEEKLKSSYKKEVHELSSCYFENTGNNKFKKHILPFMAQSSTIFDILIDDFNDDHFSDVLIVGNNYEISTQLGRLDALHGLILINDKKGFFKEIKHQDFDIPGPARNIKTINIQGEKFIIVLRNNDSPVFLKQTDDN